MPRPKPDTVILRLSLADAKTLIRSVALEAARENAPAYATGAAARGDAQTSDSWRTESAALDRHYDALTGAIRNAVHMESVVHALDSARADAYGAWRDLERSDESPEETADFRAMLGQLDALAAALGEGKDGTP